MFNVFHLLRTIMGIVQLNAYVAWCKDGMQCMRALPREHEEAGENDGGSGAANSEQGGGSRFETMKRKFVFVTRMFCENFQLDKFARWCKRVMRCLGRSGSKVIMQCGLQFQKFVRWSRRGMKRMRALVHGITSYIFTTDDDEDEDIEGKIKVNNTVIDNEIGGREVTVLPSLKKMWDGLKKGSLRPSKWLHTDRVMLSTVRWCGSYLCGMGEQWSLGEDVNRKDSEILEKFFSRDMFSMRDSLQSAEWNIDMGNGCPELMSIFQLFCSRTTRT